MDRICTVVVAASLLLSCTEHIRGEFDPTSTEPHDVQHDVPTYDDTSSSTTGDDIRLDVPTWDVGGVHGEDPDATTVSCKKVDFLFVVDNSGSMLEEQANVISNFPTFIDGIGAVLPELESIHVGVVTTDAYHYNSTGCQQLGALVTETMLTECGPYIAGSYMTEFDDLSKSFSCAANVGTTGSGLERALDATVQSLEGFINSPGQCNDGFNRDDAVTVVVIITDEDAPTDQNVDEAFDHVMYLEGSDENVVVLMLTNIDDSSCPLDVHTSTMLIDFTKRFRWGFVGDICAADYGPFFSAAVDVIDKACDELEPVLPEG